MRRSGGRRRIAVSTAAAVSAGLVLTGCASPQDAGTDASPTTLTVAIGGAPASFDPSALDLGENSMVWTGLYDTLIQADEDFSLQPGAAESWEYSDDATSLTLHLRDGLTFSNGDEATAYDAAATLQYSLDTPAQTQSLLTSVESVEATDDSTVVIALSQPDAALLPSLASSAGVIAPEEMLGDESMALTPVGSGPYVLDTERTVTGASYVLEKRDDHWNADAYPFESYTVQVIADPQAIYNALQAGELDAGRVQPDQLSTVEGLGYRSKTVSNVALGGIFFLDKTGSIVPALGDVRVRQAINHAFDRQLYVDQIALGQANPTEQTFNPGSDAYDADYEGYYDHDVEKAKELLAEAGYADGFDVTMPSSYLTTNVEPAVTQSLADIGITVTWESVPPQELTSSMYSGDYGMAFFYNGFNTPSKDAINIFGEGVLFNPFSYTDDTLDRLFAEANATTDLDAQDAIYREMSAYSVEQALNAPLYASTTMQVTKAGIVYLPDESAPTSSIRLYSVD